MYQTNRSGFGFAPGVAIAVTGGPTNPIGIAVTAATLATSLITTIGSWFGIAPRGDLQKFNRTHYPYMRTMAANSGYNVYCFWFGDVVVVAPDGSYGVAIGVDELNSRFGSPIPSASAIACIPEVEPDEFYYVTRNSSADPVNTPSADVFQLYYNGTKVENEADVYAIQQGAGDSTGTYTPPYGSSGSVYTGTGTGITTASILPTNWQSMLPLIVLGGLAAVIVFSGPQYQYRRRRARRKAA